MLDVIVLIARYCVVWLLYVIGVWWVGCGGGLGGGLGVCGLGGGGGGTLRCNYG